MTLFSTRVLPRASQLERSGGRRQITCKPPYANTPARLSSPGRYSWASLGGKGFRHIFTTLAHPSLVRTFRRSRVPLSSTVLRTSDTSVPFLTFVSCRGGFVYECQKQRDTSKYQILVWFWI